MLLSPESFLERRVSKASGSPSESFPACVARGWQIRTYMLFFDGRLLRSEIAVGSDTSNKPKTIVIKKRFDPFKIKIRKHFPILGWLASSTK